ncbi:MAG: SDR family oxidoreductase [Oscillospiraceae bacterium]|jgi:NAD(P)-dependent dehydrogenase (short-subunit alcohol dehydrogenase family)|nr:SDR family oxidoreductase [Oscillospiraceae bacterium]
MDRLAGKVAVVTGASSGIGNATAWLFAKEGAKVVMGDIKDERGVKMERDMREQNLDATFVKTDVTSTSECVNLIETAIKCYGKVDILANIAGVNGGRQYKLHEADDSIRDRLFKTNLYSIIDLCRAAIPYMLEQKSGSIVNVTSVASVIACPNDSLYGAVKGAVRSLSIGMAYDYAKDGIRVNCICPGPTKTEIGGNKVASGAPEPGAPVVSAFVQRVMSILPAARFAQPEEIAQGILFLASDEASFAYGSILTLDGGEIIA